MPTRSMAIEGERLEAAFFFLVSEAEADPEAAAEEAPLDPVAEAELEAPSLEEVVLAGPIVETTF